MITFLKRGPAAPAIPLIAAGVGAAGQIGSSLMAPKAADPYSPVQSGGNASAPIVGGGSPNFSPLQKNNAGANKYEAVQSLLQGGGY